MAISLVQKRDSEQTAGSNSSIALAYSSAVTAGNLLVCTVAVGANEASTITVSDSVNGSWTVLSEADDGTNGRSIAIAYFANTAGGTPTVTASWTQITSSINEINIFEYSGMQTSSVSDGANNAVFTSATTTPSSGNITTTNATDLIIGALAISSGSTSTLTEDANFTSELSDTFGTASHRHLNTAQRIVSATETRAYAPSLSAAATTIILIGAFKGVNAASVVYEDDSIPQFQPPPVDPIISVW